MDDKYDLRELIFSTFDDLIPPLLEGTPLEESAGSIAFGAATFAVVNIVFLMLFFHNSPFFGLSEKPLLE